MSDLDKRLDEALEPWLQEIESEYGTGIDDDKKPQFIAFANAKPKIKQAFIDAGWLDPTKVESVVMRDVQTFTLNQYEGRFPLGLDKGANDVRTGPYHSAMLDAIKKEAGLMTGQEWLSTTLKTIYEHQTSRDYLRSDKDFRASTVTIDELEGLLKKAAGIEQ